MSSHSQQWCILPPELEIQVSAHTLEGVSDSSGSGRLSRIEIACTHKAKEVAARRFELAAAAAAAADVSQP